MVRVAVDARRLQDLPLTGVGRWLANLLPHLARTVDLVLLSDARRAVPEGTWATVPLRLPPGLPEVVWLQVSAARWLRGFEGVFHGTYNAVPFARRGPSVVSIYDLSWEHHPEDFTDARRRAYAAQARWSARAASVVITVSAHARRAIIDTYGVAESQVVVAAPAVDPIFSPARVDAVGFYLERFGVSGPYVIALGGARRRGVEVAVEAWRRLPRRAGVPTLVVVGRQRAARHGDGVVDVGRVPDDAWSSLLAGARAFCYPTRFEGFGMPALEAAASGVPVVCSRVGPLPEVLGDAAEWCSSPSATDIAAGLERVLCDPDRRDWLRDAGLRQAQAAPTWSASAEVVASAYRRAGS